MSLLIWNLALASNVNLYSEVYVIALNKVENYAMYFKNRQSLDTFIDCWPHILTRCGVYIHYHQTHIGVGGLATYKRDLV